MKVQNTISTYTNWTKRKYEYSAAVDICYDNTAEDSGDCRMSMNRVYANRTVYLTKFVILIPRKMRVNFSSAIRRIQ